MRVPQLPSICGCILLCSLVLILASARAFWLPSSSYAERIVVFEDSVELLLHRYVVGASEGCVDNLGLLVL